MNLKSLSGNKKQQMLIGAFVIIVVITLVFLYYNFWRSSSSSTTLPGANQDVRLERVIENINFDAEFLKATSFQDLKLYGEWPLEIPDKGRANPFLYGN